MSSLEGCIKKLGPRIRKADADAIRTIRDDILKTEVVNKSVANEQAVEEYLKALDSERDTVVRFVEHMGGVLADRSLSSSKFAEQTKERVDELARVFPRKGIARPPLELSVRDHKMDRNISPKLSSAMLNDPHIAIEIANERSFRTIEYLFEGFYNMPPAEAIKIVANFDPVAAKKLEKGYNEDVAAQVILDWIKEHETVPIRFKVESVEGEFVDAHPEHPVAQTHKWGAVNQTAQDAEAVVGPVGRWVEKMWPGTKNSTSGDMSMSTALLAVPLSKLKDFIRYGMPSVGEYTRANKRMDGWMNERIERHAQLARKWLQYTHGKFFGLTKKAEKRGAKILGELMHATTLAGVDVSDFVFPSKAEYTKMNKTKRAMWDKRRQDYEVLLPFWDRLGGKMGGARETYQKTRYAPGAEGKSGKIVNVGPPREVSEAQHIYLQVRDTYANQRGELIENLDNRVMESEADMAAKVALIAKLRKEFEGGMITPYFPLSRFGKHWAVAKDPETGETIGFIKRESRKDRNAWIDSMLKQGFMAYPSTEQAADMDAVSEIDPNFVASVTALVDDKVMIDADGNEMPGTKIADEIWQMYLRNLPEMSARKAFIHREGRLGFTTDALRAFSDHTFHQTHQMGKLRFGYRMNQMVDDAFVDADRIEARAAMILNMEQTAWRPPGFDPNTTVHEVMFATMPEYASLYSNLKQKAGDASDAVHAASVKQARDKVYSEAVHDGPWATPLANELRKRHAYVMNPKSASWATDLTALGFAWFLSASPAAGILNLTQTPIVAYPILRGEFKGAGAGMELLRASKEFATLPWAGTLPSAVVAYKNKLKYTEGSTTMGDLAALEEFERIGMLSKTRSRDLQSVSEKGVRYSSPKESWMESIGYIFHKTEEMNRVVTGMAAYRLAMKSPQIADNSSYANDQERHDAAVLLAEEMVEMSHFDYTNTNRPRFMQGDLGRVAFLFRNYSLNMSYRLMRDFKDGVWDPMRANSEITVDQRKSARTRFLGIMGMSSMFVGVAGMPMMWALEGIANSLLGDDDDPYDIKTQSRKLIFDATREHVGEIWGEKIADAVVRGPWTAFSQADLSKRASLNNLWIREIPDNKRGSDLLLHLAGEGLGPIFGMGMDAFQAFDNIQLGHTQRGLERLMPKAITDALKTVRYATEGAQNYSQDIILSPEEFTNYELFLQAIGFSPSELTRRYEQNRAVKDMEASLKRRHKFLLDTLFRAYKLEDRKLARATLQDINEWNRSNPRVAITPKTIMASAKSRNQYDMRTVGGVAVDKRLSYLHEELRFTRRPGQ